MLNDVGVPVTIVFDNAKEEMCGKFKRKASEHGAIVKSTEPCSPWQQVAEGAIKEIKHTSVQNQTKAKLPCALWDLSVEFDKLTIFYWNRIGVINPFVHLS